MTRIRNLIRLGLSTGLLLLSVFSPTALAAQPIRVGNLAYGTLGWELATIQDSGLDKANGIEIHSHPLASPQAGTVALLAGDVDLIVSDWIWVSRQRESGADFSFAPYSSNHGVLLVPPGSPIGGVADLAGKRLGVAGGGLDKNWLLLQTLAKEKHGLDLEKASTVVFGAPPLLKEQLRQGKLDALMDYWHYAAELEAMGYRALFTGQDLMKQLGVNATVPSLGYVFRAAWAERNRSSLDGLLTAAGEAKRLLCESDDSWEKVKPLTREEDPSVRANLRKGYCAGRVQRWGKDEQQAAEEVYRLLKKTGGAEATGEAGGLAPGTFWPHAATH